VLRCPTVCNESGCRQPSERGSRWCRKHQSSNSSLEDERWRKKHDAVSQMYNRAPWPRFRETMLAQNPICQRIQKDGSQCRNAATLVHHLISPRVRPDLFVDPANVACLCGHCHPTEEGTPLWRPGTEYVPTKFTLPHI
jgi:hypothetical protein